jgi:5-methylcytosine-specific restriction endonuclease McrA
METCIQNNLIDSMSVISDLTDTDNNTTTSFDIENKINEIVSVLNDELNKLNLDNLKEKAKELGINGLSKLKKPEIIQLLETEFFKLLPILKEKQKNDLKNICKQTGIKGITGHKKEALIYLILKSYSSNLKFKLDNIQTSEENEEKDDKEKCETIIYTKPLSLIEQLKKQQEEIENKIKEETKKQEEEKKRIEDQERKLKEEEEKKRIEEEKKEAKKKKQSIPKNVRVIIWNHYIGEDIIKHKCLCCKKVTITNTNFDVGHVISEKNGGTHEINNLRPICFACNHSMGAENMIDFVVKYGLYIG